MKFTKMQGLGNDFVVINDVDDSFSDYPKMAAELCDRHFGIGADGILVIKRGKEAPYKMLIYNADGSGASMCGNGVRCFAKYLYENGMEKGTSIDIETLDGIKKVELQVVSGRVQGIRVNMGKPSFEPQQIPAVFDGDRVVDREITIGDEKYKITSLHMGVPHTIVFVEDLDGLDIKDTGGKIEESSYFPQKTNVNFVKVISHTEYRVRTWERGAGATLACGTGTCASLIACVLNGKTQRTATAHVPGGKMIVEWAEDGSVFMTGPAVAVFTGTYNSANI